jgi:hypothetical protein
LGPICPTFVEDVQLESFSENRPVLGTWIFLFKLGLTGAKQMCDRGVYGYCTAGFVVSAKALLEKNPHPTEENCKKALTGNICCWGLFQTPDRHHGSGGRNERSIKWQTLKESTDKGKISGS